MQQQSEQSRPKVHKQRQTKLDKDGNRPEVSVYAKAYNKVKAQFSRIRYRPAVSVQAKVALMLLLLSSSTMSHVHARQSLFCMAKSAGGLIEAAARVVVSSYAC